MRTLSVVPKVVYLYGQTHLGVTASTDDRSDEDLIANVASVERGSSKGGQFCQSEIRMVRILSFLFLGP